MNDKMAKAGVYEFTVTVVSLHSSSAPTVAWADAKMQWTVEWKRGSGRGEEKRGAIPSEARLGSTLSELPLRTTMKFRSELRRGSSSDLRAKELRLRFWKHEHGQEYATGTPEYKCSIDLTRCLPPYNETFPIIQMKESNVTAQLCIHAVLRAEAVKRCFGRKSLRTVDAEEAFDSGLSWTSFSSSGIGWKGDSLSSSGAEAKVYSPGQQEPDSEISVRDEALPYPVGTKLRFTRRQGSFTPAECGHLCAIEAASPVVVFVVGKGQCHDTIKCRIPAQKHIETASDMCVCLPEFIAECKTAFLVPDRGELRGRTDECENEPFPEVDAGHSSAPPLPLLSV